MAFRRRRPEPTVATTAQDAYSAMIRDHLSPRLRALGFKGSGGAYEWPSQSHWIILGVQKSQSSSAMAVKFTLNCQVVRRDVWQEERQEHSYLGEKPNPNTIAGNVWWARIGRLMPGGEDKWWWLRPSQDLEGLAEEVASAVHQYVVPAIQREVEGTSGGKR